MSANYYASKNRITNMAFPRNFILNIILLIKQQLSAIIVSYSRREIIKANILFQKIRKWRKTVHFDSDEWDLIFRLKFSYIILRRTVIKLHRLKDDWSFVLYWIIHILFFNLIRFWTSTSAAFDRCRFYSHQLALNICVCKTVTSVLLIWIRWETRFHSTAWLMLPNI